MTLPKILVSACLLGRPVRYDGAAKTLHDTLLDRWISEGRVVSVCPEVMAGLPTPRPPAEIAGGASGAAVIERAGRIVEAGGNDVTEAYLAGARIALEHAVRHDCRHALLTDGSPSCGGSFIYDGSFEGRRIAGEGVTAALLRQQGIAVFSPAEISALAAALDG
ncbi:DUF523 domain-containing protein [Sphingomonas hankookensis]|uniref:DUF523 domain-containing protein n=1 Tax=Sphingomonas hankookensis TaxID=563996 RepID=UPI00234EB13F|nr:DUF523 domain-containing protein [Sphingomonas hankookensis]WCP71906.1 DUF523 domain-containing protein [Sphingomonas hankookensis]